MYFSDHAPPHFHAIYSDYEAEVSVASGNIIDGRLPRRAQALVTEWARLHRNELEQDWERAQAHQPLAPIAPLE